MHYLAIVLVRVADPADVDVDDAQRAVEPLLAAHEGSQWDWFQVPGRWSGFLLQDAYDPAKDPANIDTCWLCAGTGKRRDACGLQQLAVDPTYTCNGCRGTGRMVKWPTDWKPAGFACPGPLFLTMLQAAPVKITPYALVLPDGTWHDRGDGYSSPEKPAAVWQAEVQALVASHIGLGELTAIVVDCHV